MSASATPTDPFLAAVVGEPSVVNEEISMGFGESQHPVAKKFMTIEGSQEEKEDRSLEREEEEILGFDEFSGNTYDLASDVRPTIAATVSGPQLQTASEANPFTAGM